MLIIGICGQPSSGKDTAAHYLQELGFKHISNGDRIREDMIREGLTLERTAMRDYAAAKRESIGGFYPVNLSCPLIKEDTVMTGFRNTAELDYVKKYFKDDFVLISLTAPFEIRYERARERKRHGDNISIEQFKAEEEAERQGNPQTHEVDAVIARADYHLENDGTRKELELKISKLVRNIRHEHES